MKTQARGNEIRTEMTLEKDLDRVSSIIVGRSDGGGVEDPPCFKIGHSDPRAQWISKPVF